MILKKIVGVSGIGSLFSSSLSCPNRDGEINHFGSQIDKERLMCHIFREMKA
jgi:hypothetical protein